MVARTANDSIKKRNEEFPGIYYRTRCLDWSRARWYPISFSAYFFTLDRCCVHIRTHMYTNVFRQ